MQKNQTMQGMHWKFIAFFLAVYDVFAVNAAHFLALWVRFDCRFSRIPEEYLTSFLHFAPVYTLLCLLVLWWMRLYNSVWRFASFSEFVRVAISSGILIVLHVTITVVAGSVSETSEVIRMPISYYLLGAMVQFLLILAVRFSYRALLLLRDLRLKEGAAPSRVMLIGAGAAGQLVLHSINQSGNLKEKVVCIIDDNPNKWARYIDGVPIVGGRDDILSSAKDYRVDKIIVAIPSATPAQRRDILNICKESGCEMKNLPDVYRLVSGEIPVQNALVDVSMEDLLGRKPVSVDMEEICRFLRGKTILVTGGGGSIGSELCRQIAQREPKLLILFDMYENNAYEVENELRRKYPKLNLEVLIGSVRDSARIEGVFKKYRPEVVYHAAAHKHVPLMEGSPCEAVKNNVFGTYKTAFAAMKYGCERFVLISTDKAVNPTNVMGASKRICEMIIQSFDRMIQEHREREIPRLYAHMEEDAKAAEESLPEDFTAVTSFVAVRFGNVLGSNGSVVPLFKKQIEEGGPVTVTHPDIVRYFMTIPEAVSLVLQAGALGHRSCVMVLDMGECVRIDTLARNLIKLYGLRPDIDIKVVYTGLRPGEKLFEEKLMDEEGLQMTPNRLIFIGSPIPIDVGKFFSQLKELMKTCYEEDCDIRRAIAEIVPTYRVPDETQEKKSA